MTFADDAVPVLPRGVRLHDDPVRGITLLLAPERVLKLNAVETAILSMVDGTASFSSIVARLVSRYDAPVDRISSDVRTFLCGLRDRQMLVLTP